MEKQQQQLSGGVEQHHKKGPSKMAKAKAKRKPMKVVYISNPMRFLATVAQFRPLVQRLTGQHSDIADQAPHHFPAPPTATPPADPPATAARRETCFPFEMFDEGFASAVQLDEDFHDFTPAASMFYKTSPYVGAP